MAASTTADDATTTTTAWGAVGHRAPPPSSSSSSSPSSSSSRCVRILVLGGPDAGKTSLVRRYVHGTFDHDYHGDRGGATGGQHRRRHRRIGIGRGDGGGAGGGATVGSYFVTKRVVNPLYDDGHSPSRHPSHVNVQLWDTAGLEHFFDRHPNPHLSPADPSSQPPPGPGPGPGDAFFRNADGAMLTYDSTSSRSFDALTRWHEELTSRRRRRRPGLEGDSGRWRPLFGGGGGGEFEDDDGEEDQRQFPIIVVATKVDALKEEVSRPFDLAVPQRDVLGYDLRHDDEEGGGGGGDMGGYGLRSAHLGDVTRIAGETGYRHVASRLPPSAVVVETAAAAAAADVSSSNELEARHGGGGGGCEGEGEGQGHGGHEGGPSTMTSSSRTTCRRLRVGVGGGGDDDGHHRRRTTGAGAGAAAFPGGGVMMRPPVVGEEVGGAAFEGWWDPRIAWRSSSFAHAEAVASASPDSLPDRSRVLAWCERGGRGDDRGGGDGGGGGVSGGMRRGGRPVAAAAAAAASIEHVETSALDGTGVDEAVEAILRLALARPHRREETLSSVAEEPPERLGEVVVAANNTASFSRPPMVVDARSGDGTGTAHGHLPPLHRRHPPPDRPPPHPPPPPTMPPQGTRHYRPNRKLDLYARYSKKNGVAAASTDTRSGGSETNNGGIIAGVGRGPSKSGRDAGGIGGGGWSWSGGLFASCLGGSGGQRGGAGAPKPTATAAEVLGRSLT